MRITAASLKPRAFDNWDFDLGASARTKVQLHQYTKHAVSFANWVLRDVKYLRTSMESLEGRIHRELNAPVLSLPIMVVDDQQSILTAVERSLRLMGFNNITTFADSRRAAEAARYRAPALVITDFDMPGALQGHDLIAQVASIPDLAKPAFILHSGNQATRSPIGAVAAILQAHHVISIMKGDHELPQLIFQIALARVKGLPFTLPEAPRVEDPANYAALKKTPGFRITSAVMHRLNNLCAIIESNLSYYQEHPNNADVVADIKSALDELLQFVSALKDFFGLDLNTINDITTTGLYAKLTGHELSSLETNFPLLPRQSRNNVKIPLEQIFQEGLAQIVPVWQSLAAALSLPKPEVQNGCWDQEAQARARLRDIVLAASLTSTKGNEQMVIAFAIAYGLMTSTSSGSSSPSSPSASS